MVGLKFKNKGLFYSDLISYAEVKRIINNLISTDSSKWKSILIKEKRANTSMIIKIVS